MEKKKKIQWTDRLFVPVVRIIPGLVKPNHLTYVRATLVVPVAACLWHGLHALAVILLAIAILCDILDGAVARIRGEQSANGEWLDAYADKLLIVGLLLIYGWNYFPAVLIWAIVITEVFLSAGRPIKLWFKKSGKANSFGKMKMWCQSAAMFGLAAGAGWTLYLANYFLWAALAFACLSIAWHVRDIVA